MFIKNGSMRLIKHKYLKITKLIQISHVVSKTKLQNNLNLFYYTLIFVNDILNFL